MAQRGKVILVTHEAYLLHCLAQLIPYIPYVFLLFAPLLLIPWLVEHMPIAMRPNKELAVEVVSPLVYIFSFLGLRSIKSKTRFFILIAIFMYSLHAYAAGKRAFAAGTERQWFDFLFCTLAAILMLGVVWWAQHRDRQASQTST